MAPEKSKTAFPKPKDEDALIQAIESSDADLKAKMDACRGLGHVGTAKAIPVLAELLGKDELSHMARYGLEPIPDSAVDDVFRSALGKLEGRLLAGVVGSIGVRRDGKAVGALIDLLENNDADVCTAAARSLARIAAPEAVKALSVKVAAAPANVRMAVADACLECAEKLVASGRRKEASKLYATVHQAELPEHVRNAASPSARGSAVEGR